MWKACWACFALDTAGALEGTQGALEAQGWYGYGYSLRALVWGRVHRWTLGVFSALSSAAQRQQPTTLSTGVTGGINVASRPSPFLSPSQVLARLSF